MAAKARQIVAEGSAQARLGAKLRELRTLSGLSQARLGAAVHCSSDLIRRIEATERFPARELIEECDRVLAGGGVLVDLWDAANEERRRLAAPTACSSGRRLWPARFAPEHAEATVARWADTEPSPVPTGVGASSGPHTTTS